MDKSRSNEWLKQINNQLYVYNQETGQNKQIVDSKPTAVTINDYFSDTELQGFKAKYDPIFLKNLNILRDRWGKAISVSTAEGATGRHKGISQSYHNIDYYGKVRAIDLFPGISKVKDALLFIGMAQACGFTGIGVYPKFSPTWGFHLDNRLDPETWVDLAKYPAHDYDYGDIETILTKNGFK